MPIYKVLFVTTGTLSKNGSIQRAVHLARASRDFGIEARILMLETEQNRRLVEQFSVSNQVRWVGGRNLKLYLAQREAVAWCDVLHLIAPTLAGMSLALAARRLGRFVLSDWDELYVVQADRLSGRIRRFILQWGNALITDGYIFASRALQHWYRSRGGSKPNTYIPYGLWPQISNGAPQDLIGSDGPGWVFYLGGYHRVYREDLRQVIELARIAARAGLGFMLAGQGPELAGLEAKLREILPAERLKILGFVQDVDELLRDSMIKLCFLPVKDTLQNRCRCPNKMFHYALAGKMVLTNRVGEVWEILGNQAEYYEFGNIQSMQTAFASALNRQPKYDFAPMDWHRRAGEYHFALEQFLKADRRLVPNHD